MSSKARVHEALPTRLPVQYAKVKNSYLMIIGFISPSGIFSEHEITCTKQQYVDWVNNIDTVQRIFPLMDADQRELFITGMGPKEFALTVSQR